VKNAVFWDVTLCGSFMNRRFGGTYRSIIMVKRTSELGPQLLVTANVSSSLILFTAMMEAIHYSETSVLQEPHGVTYHKTIFFR
jgi:hypothetical protein